MSDQGDVEDLLVQLRSQWEFAAISQFLVQFRQTIELDDDYITEDLELALIQTEEEHHLIAEIAGKLLKLLKNQKNISSIGWFQEYQKEHHKRIPEDKSMEEISNFIELSLRDKVLIFHRLCEWQLDNPDSFKAKVHQDEIEETDWRVDPIGVDSKFNSYWLFDDYRLYRESPSPETLPRKKGKRPKTTAPSWDLLCRTSEEWSSFPSTFENSRNQTEKLFYKLLVEEVLPSILPELQGIEKARKKKEKLQEMPRKRSARLQALEIQRVEQEKLIEEHKKFTDQIKQIERAASDPLVNSPHDKSSQSREERLKAREEKRIMLLEKQFTGMIEGINRESSDSSFLSESPHVVDSEDETKTNYNYNLNRNGDRKNENQITESKVDQGNVNETPKDKTSRRSHSKELLQTPEKDHNSEFKTPKSAKSAQNSKKQSKDPKSSKDSKSSSTTKPKKTQEKKYQKKSLDLDGRDDEKIGGEEEEEEEEEWQFSCVCGLSGQNYDDGTEMISCEKCQVWQHTKCNGLKKKDLASLVFICLSCAKPKTGSPKKIEIEKDVKIEQTDKRNQEQKEQKESEEKTPKKLDNEIKNEVERDEDQEDDEIELEEVEEQEKEWQFRCICGVHGKNYDDGTGMIACGSCQVWQHVECNSLKVDQLETISFTCKDCVRKKKEKIKKLKKEKEKEKEKQKAKDPNLVQNGIPSMKKLSSPPNPSSTIFTSNKSHPNSLPYMNINMNMNIPPNQRITSRTSPTLSLNDSLITSQTPPLKSIPQFNSNSPPPSTNFETKNLNEAKSPRRTGLRPNPTPTPKASAHREQIEATHKIKTDPLSPEYSNGISSEQSKHFSSPLNHNILEPNPHKLWGPLPNLPQLNFFGNESKFNPSLQKESNFSVVSLLLSQPGPLSPPSTTTTTNSNTSPNSNLNFLRNPSSPQIPSSTSSTVYDSSKGLNLPLLRSPPQTPSISPLNGPQSTFNSKSSTPEILEKVPIKNSPSNPKNEDIDDPLSLLSGAALNARRHQPTNINVNSLLSPSDPLPLPQTNQEPHLENHKPNQPHFESTPLKEKIEVAVLEPQKMDPKETQN